MKTLKQIYLDYEQEILFIGLITYLAGLLFLFDYGIAKEWKELFWIIQFLGLGGLLFFRGKQKNWKWPRRP